MRTTNKNVNPKIWITLNFQFIGKFSISNLTWRFLSQRKICAKFVRHTKTLVMKKNNKKKTEYESHHEEKELSRKKRNRQE